MFIVRKLKAQDRLVFTNVFSQTVNEEFPEYTIKTKKYFGEEIYIKKQFVGNTIFGTFDGEKLVGFLVANEPFGGILFIPWIMVIKDYQRKGIGTILLEKIEEYARKEGVHSIHLETYDRDLEYYKKREYKEYGFDKNSYFGADAYLMKKEIQEPKEKNYLKY